MPVKINKGTSLASLNLTPLIDMVFLLLIFFLVASRLSDEDREVDVQLPTASEAKPLIVEPREIFINIDREGTYFLGRDRLTIEQVEQELRRVHTNNPLGQKVILRADKRCDWDDVVSAINACHRVGIEEVIPTSAGEE